LWYPAKKMKVSGLRVKRGLAFILDLDGVVVDSMPVHTLAWQRYLESLGIQKEEIVSGMHGRRNDEIVREFVGYDLPEQLVLQHGAAKERLYRELIAPDLIERLVGGVAQFLSRAAEVPLPLALATNAERANATFVLEYAHLRHLFKVVADSSQVTKPKPAADIYLFTARQLGIAARNCIVFEDSPVGIDAARAAGMRVVGIQSHTEFLESVDLAVKDFLDPELEPWLASQQVF
jgi:beta-phosphoglucomutase